jgi:predicted TIM-barrel fold metal-dependent hydrolase
MIDMHIHAVNPMLPGDDPFDPLWDGPADILVEMLRREMDEAGVDQALAMGRLDAPADDPLGIGGTLQLSEAVPGLHAIGVGDPTRQDSEHFRRVEEQLASGRVRALKAYLGYVHFGPEHPNYAPYYRLAARHGVPVIFHTGDTVSRVAKLKYAHPMLVDEVAVDFPDVTFVMAHFGNPWLTDAAEVIYKNDNVWADLSGLLIGDDAEFEAWSIDGTLAEVATSVRRAYRYADRPDRFLYGSDWPLAPMAAYAGFIRSIIPESDWGLVFEENARRLFLRGA